VSNFAGERVAEQRSQLVPVDGDRLTITAGVTTPVDHPARYPRVMGRTVGGPPQGI
jgi:hypothetical protein